MSRLPAPTPDRESFVCAYRGFLCANRITADDELRLFALAARPLARLPFPYLVIDGHGARR